MQRLGVVLALIAAATLVTAGCGAKRSTKDEPVKNRYVDQVNRTQRDFAARVATLAAAITPTTSPARDRATLRRFQAAVRTAVQQLQAISAPASVTALHQRLVAAMEEFGRAIRAAERGLHSRSPARLLVVRRRLVRATRSAGVRIDATIAAINTKLRR